MTTTDDVRPGDAAVRVLELHRHYVEPHDSEPMERHYCEHCGENWPCDASALAAEVQELRVRDADEHDRLAAEVAALRAAVRALKPPIGVAEIWGNAECVYCIGDDDRGNVTHAPDCPWAQLRALAGEVG